MLQKRRLGKSLILGTEVFADLAIEGDNSHRLKLRRILVVSFPPATPVEDVEAIYQWEIALSRLNPDRINALADRIRPVVDIAPHGLSYIKRMDPFFRDYLGNAKFLKKAKNLTPIGDITTYHPFSSKMFFDPTIAEVLAQIPEEYLQKGVYAFQIIKQPRNSDDLNNNLVATNEHLHVATTRLYALSG
jgi:hypothetical protein